MLEDVLMLKEDNIDIQSVQDFLPDVEALNELDEDTISDITSRVSLLKFEAGEHLIWSGGLGQYLLLIKQGRVYVSLDSKDVELGSGSIVGEMALLSRKPSKADVVALEDSEALAINFDDFQSLMMAHSNLATSMTELMKSRMFGPDGLNSLTHYKITEAFSSGSALAIFNAIDIKSGRQVAIRMLSYEMTSQPRFKERFKKDSDIVSQIKHPNIVRVIETVEDYSTEFVVMEKLKGCDLEYTLAKQGVFNEKQTSGVISKVAMALEYAGKEENGGLLHQNIMLSNILQDELGHVKVMGYGLPANFNDEAAIPYMAPEVLQKQAADYRADIYSLGVTAFIMLTGKMPYSSSTVEALIYEQNGSLSPDINSIVRDLPEGLAEFVNRALIRDPVERISNWFEIQTLLTSGKGSSLNLLSDEKMDMAMVIQLQTVDVDTALLKREIHKVMDVHHAQYEMEIVTRDNTNIDFSR